ncbi:helix-turn-helix transcriptional regulator [Lapidilactobacillus dextrinicus]|nr:helix-turn-helix transcriptional regulator [Lapidilactobacillus dextrinicus]QFG46669.1 helix-turn-helix transcriptional regulator [Lapidilactobacillus dextrinicus]
MNVSTTINRVLEEHHMTAYGLSRKTGLPTATIYQLEKGISKDVKLSTLIKIADALDISLDEFRK